MLYFLRSPAVLSLVVLVVQNSALVVMTKASKQRVTKDASVEPYYTSTLVLNQEIVKMIFCLLLFMKEWRSIRDKRLGSGAFLSRESDDMSDGKVVSSPTALSCVKTHAVQIPIPAMPTGNGSDDQSSFANELYHQVFNWETMKLLIPSALFTMQNYLIFVALSYLDAMTFQMLSQSKLISAAVLSVLILDKQLSRMQWISLCLLTFGVYLSQGYQSATIAAASPPRIIVTSTTQAAPENLFHFFQQWIFYQPTTIPETTTAPPTTLSTNSPTIFSGTMLVGALACVLSGVSSSFAGVYFEKVVKTTAPSLAVRNIHLSLFSIPLALISMLVIDVVPTWFDDTLPPFSYWRGYDRLTFSLVFVHAMGGLLVAVVVKYADNILKGFATAVAIIVSGVYMAIFDGYLPSLWFLAGCALVCISTILYQVFEVKGQVSNNLKNKLSRSLR